MKLDKTELGWAAARNVCKEAGADLPLVIMMMMMMMTMMMMAMMRLVIMVTMMTMLGGC